MWLILACELDTFSKENTYFTWVSSKHWLFDLPRGDVSVSCGYFYWSGFSGRLTCLSEWISCVKESCWPRVFLDIVNDSENVLSNSFFSVFFSFRHHIRLMFSLLCLHPLALWILGILWDKHPCKPCGFCYFCTSVSFVPWWKGIILPLNYSRIFRSVASSCKNKET